MTNAPTAPAQVRDPILHYWNTKALPNLRDNSYIQNFLVSAIICSDKIGLRGLIYSPIAATAVSLAQFLSYKSLMHMGTSQSKAVAYSNKVRELSLVCSVGFLCLKKANADNIMIFSVSAGVLGAVLAPKLIEPLSKKANLPQISSNISTIIGTGLALFVSDLLLHFFVKA
ncbi:MAG: hypothetical protein ACPGUD_00925 [Parashewanella sp.]